MYISYKTIQDIDKIPELTKINKALLINMINIVEPLYKKYKSLTFAYLIYKCAELLRLKINYKLSKNRKKIIQQDIIWENICKEIGWIFIPSN